MRIFHNCKRNIQSQVDTVKYNNEVVNLSLFLCPLRYNLTQVYPEIIVPLLVCLSKPAVDQVSGGEEGCQVPEDCPGPQLWCDTSDGRCKYGCDEQEDCPDGHICVIANHMCQC